MEQINQLDIRNANLKAVYRIIRDGDNVSRASAARELSLSRTALSSLVDELIADGMIVEAGKKGNAGAAGRTPMTLATSSDRIFVTSIVWKPGCVEGHVIDVTRREDLKGSDGRRLVIPVEDPNAYLSASLTCAAQLSAAYTAGKTDLATVCVVPGIVDPIRGSILSVPLGISEEIGGNILRELCMEHKGEPICLVNDTAMLAHAEQLANADCRKDFVYINFAVGVGAVFYMNGRPISDASGRNTQFGHIIVEPGGRKCRCGARGCLETMIGEEAIKERYASLFTGQQELKLGEGSYYRILREQCEAGKPEAMNAMEEVVSIFAKVLSNAATIAFPDRVVIGGSGKELGEGFIESVQKKVRESGFSYITRNLQVSGASYDNEAEYMAAADYVFSTYYDFALKSIGGIHLG